MRALVDRYIQAYNRIDVAGMLTTLHAGVVFENYGAGTLALRTEGVDAFGQLALRTQGLFSARRQVITGYVEHDGLATAQIQFDGTFAVDLPNGVRAGQSVSMPGRSQFRAHDGLLIYIADHSD